MPAVFKGAISFGLVNIPVELFTATQESDIHFHMMHKCGGRIRYKKTCPDCEIEDVKQSDIVKGFEYEEDKYVIFTDADFDKIKTEKDKNITILHFADLEEVDPLYCEKSYYVVPKGSEKAYTLLRKAMEKTGKVAVARSVIGTKEHMVLIRSFKEGLVLETLFYDDEIRARPFPAPEDITAAELNMAEKLISGMVEDFQPKTYANAYKERVMEAIEKKIAGKEISKPKETKQNNIIDLMDALKKSVEQQGKKTSAKSSKDTKSVKRTAKKPDTSKSKKSSAKSKPVAHHKTDRARPTA